MSGPLLDRIDLRVVMPRLAVDQLVDQGAAPENSRTVAIRIAGAWQLAQQRNGGVPNALLRGRHLTSACRMDPNTRSTLKDVAAALDLTARSVHRLMRVARTIADLRGQEPLGRDEILAAASLRDRSMETELAA